MRGISSVVKERIETIVDRLFDRMGYQMLGNLPKYSNNRNIFVGYEYGENMAHLFIKTLGSKYLLPAEEDALKGLLSTASNYVDALKHKTKANLVNDIESFVLDSRKDGIEPSMRQIKKKVNDHLDKAKSHIKLIGEAESTKARNMGKAFQIAKVGVSTGTDDPTVCFIIVKDKVTCQECIRVHTTNGVTPRAFKLSEVSFNYHKKGENFPSVCGLHPHCFTGDVRLQTDAGYLTFKELNDLQVPIRVSVDSRVVRGDGIQIFDQLGYGSATYSSTKVYDTGFRNCFKFTFVNGAALSVSEDHEMWVKQSKSWEKIKARDLKVGDTVPFISGEGQFGQENFVEYADALGNQKLASLATVPSLVWSGNRETVKTYLQSVVGNNFQILNGVGLVYFSNNLSILNEVQTLLSMFGIPTSVNLKQNESNINIYGKAAVSLFMEKIGLTDGFKAKQVFNQLNSIVDAPLNFEGGVISVENLGMKKTYSVTVPVVNSVTANGIVTGNCRCTLTTIPMGYGYVDGKLKFVDKDFDYYKSQRE